MTLAARAKKMKRTMIIVIKVFHKMIPHKYFQFSLNGYDRLTGVDDR